MATPTWNKSRGLWVIQGQKNGIKKTFYSSIPGQRGKREVLDKYDDWVEFGGVQKITVSRCVELYLKDIEARLGKREAYKTAEQYCRLYLVPTLGNAKMDNLSIRDYQAILNDARPHSAHVKSLSNKTLQNLRGVLVGFHKFAYNNYYCEAWRGTLYIPRGHQKNEREILQPEDIKKLFIKSDLWYLPAFQTMLLCGLRPSEVLGIQLGDIGDGILRIRRAITDDGFISEGKTKNARRTVPLPPLAEEIIRNTIERNKPLDTNWVFCGFSGEVGNQNTMRKHWNKLKKEYGLPGTPYSLRHTFVSIVSAQTQISSGTLKELIGHSESFDTYNTYKHSVSGELESAAQVINLTFERLKAENT